MPFLPFSKVASAPKDAEHWCREIALRLLIIGTALSISGLLVAAVSGFGLCLLTNLPNETTVAKEDLIQYLGCGVVALLIGASTLETAWRFRKAGRADESVGDRLMAALRALTGTLGWLIPFCVLFLSLVTAILVLIVIRVLQ